MSENRPYLSYKERRIAQIRERRREEQENSSDKAPDQPGGRLKLTPEKAVLLKTLLIQARAQGLDYEQIASGLGEEFGGITVKQLRGFASSHGITARK